MTLDLSDEETRALLNVLMDAIEDARYPLSPRVRTLEAILARLQPPKPAPAPLPPRKHYEPPSKGRYGRRG